MATSPLQNPTARFLGDPVTFPQARLTLNDVHGLWGGRVVTVAGAGAVVVRTVSPARWERRSEFRLEPARVRELLALCIEQDLLSVTFPARAAIRPDETRATITLTNAAGAGCSVGCWAGDPRDPRFETIQAPLLALERHAGNLEPVYEGPSDRFQSSG